MDHELVATLPGAWLNAVRDTSFREMIKALIALAAVGTILFCWLLQVGALKAGRKRLAAALAILAVLAGAAYVEFGHLRFGHYMNPHDFFHYYVGAKYSPEIGYAGLYRAVLVADAEDGATYTDKDRIRDLETYRYRSAVKVLGDAERHKAAFNARRWEEFKADVRYYRALVPSSKWKKMLRDKGYNATPTWNMVARFLANRIPTDSAYGMAFLVALDPVLILAMFGFVCWAFGWRTSLVAVIFFGTNFMMNFVHIKGAFLRLDWLAGLVIGICLLKRRCYAGAGACVAYAAAARIFPAVYLFGMGAQCLWRLVRRRRIEGRYLRFFLAVAVTLTVLVGATGLVDGDFDGWQAFGDKIGMHNRDISNSRVGFKYIFVWWPDTHVQKARAFEQHQVLWWTLQAVALLVSFLAVRKLEDYESLAFGFVPGFFLAAPTFYYYVVLVVPLFVFAPKLNQRLRMIGLVSMFAISIALYVAHGIWALGFELSFVMSLLLLGLVGLLMLTAVLARTTPPVTGNAAPDPATPRLEANRPGFPRKRVTLVLVAVAVALTGWAFFPSRGRFDGPEPGPDDVSLVLVGDVMLSRNVAKSVIENDRDFSFPFLATADYTRSADLSFCNLESAISIRGNRVAKKYTFRAPPKSVEGLVFAGFDVVSLANNHILDYGPAAMDDTIASLTEAGIMQVGICPEDEAQAPVVLVRQGVRIGFLAYADPHPKFAYADEFLAFETRPAHGLKETIQRDLENLAKTADVVVVSLHWGIEYQLRHDARQEDLGRFIIDHGADIVAGHHPHVLQAPEWYKHGLIIYSMGNFVFDQYSRPPTRLSRLYRVFIRPEGVTRAEYLPLRIQRNDWQPRPQSGEFIPLDR